MIIWNGRYKPYVNCVKSISWRVLTLAWKVSTFTKLYQNDQSELLLPNSTCKTLQTGSLTFSSKIIQLKYKRKLYKPWFRFENCLYLWDAKLHKLGKAHVIIVLCHSNLYHLQLIQVSNILFPHLNMMKVYSMEMFW